jgi:glycosyltransferase involved in cell wall biosynthesis
VQVVPYGLQPGRVRPAAVVRPRRPLRLGFCGVLSPWKAAHVAIDAVRRTQAAVELTVHGRLHEPMFADYIASLRARAGDDGRIRFANAFDSSQIDRVFAEMDVLVVPSTWYENTPFVVLEAFAAGVPVFASDLGGLSEIVRDGANGRLFPAGDVAALARLIEACAADPRLLADLRPSPPHDVAADYEQFRQHYVG